jgi:hypothetical protein
MTIIATETFSNGIVSMFKGEIREIADGDTEYTALLEEGLVEEYSAGGGGGAEPFIIRSEDHPDEEKDYLDKTWKEIKEAFMSGKPCIGELPVESGGVRKLYYKNLGSVEYDPSYETMGYSIYFFSGTYSCNSENDYPSLYYGG